MNLTNKSILITGGTGSLGKALTKRIFNTYPNVKRLVIFSRDEQKQFQMAQEYPINEFYFVNAINYIISHSADYKVPLFFINLETDFKLRESA